MVLLDLDDVDWIDELFNFVVLFSYDMCILLNVIKGFFEIMWDEYFGLLDNDCYKDYVLDIYFSSIYLLGLVNNLLELFKIKVG